MRPEVAGDEKSDPWHGTVGQRKGPIYTAEQVKVPEELQNILRLWTKELLKEKPKDIVAFSASYFAEKAKESRTPAASGT